MPEVQTQIVGDIQNVSTIQQQIQDQQIVESFKQKLAQLRSARYALLQERKALYDEVMSEVQSREDLLAMFKSEAAQMYPETIPQDIRSVLKQVSPDHPLAQLWGKYKVKLGPMMSRLAHSFNEFKRASKDAVATEEAEMQVLNEYQAFAETAPTPVPSTEEIVTELISTQAIPEVDEASLIASMSAIEMLDPDAADMLMLQAVNEEEQLAADELAAAERAAAGGNGIKPVGLVIGGLVLAYLIFG